MKTKILTAIALSLISTTALAKEEISTSGWFRMDHDALGLQLWAGATYDLKGPVDISSNIYMNLKQENSGACPPE